MNSRQIGVGFYIGEVEDVSEQFRKKDTYSVKRVREREKRD